MDFKPLSRADVADLEREVKRLRSDLNDILKTLKMQTERVSVNDKQSRANDCNETLRSTIQDYFKREKHYVRTYHLSESLIGSGIVPMAYLQRRLSSAAVFRNATEGATNRLKATVGKLLDTGELTELGRQDTFNRYGFRGRCFTYNPVAQPIHDEPETEINNGWQLQNNEPAQSKGPYWYTPPEQQQSNAWGTQQQPEPEKQLTGRELIEELKRRPPKPFQVVAMSEQAIERFRSLEQPEQNEQPNDSDMDFDEDYPFRKLHIGQSFYANKDYDKLDNIWEAMQTANELPNRSFELFEHESMYEFARVM